MDPYLFSLHFTRIHQLSSLIQFPTTSLTTTATLFNKSLLKKFSFVLQEFFYTNNKNYQIFNVELFSSSATLDQRSETFSNGTKTSSVQILLTKSGIGRQSNVLSTVFFLLFSWSIFHLKSIRLVFGFSILGHTILTYIRNKRFSLLYELFKDKSVVRWYFIGNGFKGKVFGNFF